MRKGTLAVLVGLLMLAAPAAAQETTGAIVGVVNDTSGAVLPGVTVQATGPAGIVNAVSDEKGEFRFPRLPSGVYKVNASLSGFTTRESTVDLTVGTTARVEFALSVSGVTEAVQVSAAAVGVDLTSSATATNISREKIELLPRGRDFTDVVGQAAGAANESQAGGISIDGASGSENRFVIDGIDTTSPQDGHQRGADASGLPRRSAGQVGGLRRRVRRLHRRRHQRDHQERIEQLARRRAVRVPEAELGRRRAVAPAGQPARATPSPTSTRPRTTRRASIRAATSAAGSSRIGSGSSAPISPVSASTERTVTFSNGVDQHLRPGLQGPLRHGQRHRQRRLEAALPRWRQLLALRDRAVASRSGRTDVADGRRRLAAGHHGRPADLLRVGGLRAGRQVRALGPPGSLPDR